MVSISLGIRRVGDSCVAGKRRRNKEKAKFKSTNILFSFVRGFEVSI